jgi:hypothetical protein
MLFLPYLPLATVLVGMFSVKYIRCHEFDCMDIMQDTLACDMCRVHEDGAFGCFCCTMCENPEQLYDDSSEEFHSYYSKKS